MRSPRHLQLYLSVTDGARYARRLSQLIRAAHAVLNPSLSELSIAFVNDAKMSELHERFLGIAGPTDVLTFELEHDSRGRVTAGEVVICVPEARRQARLQRSTVERELLLYALHGVLHLIGFDDRTAAGYRKMHRKEDEILTRLGVGPVFESNPPLRRSVADNGGK